ncbi:MAG: glycogen synthase [Acidobacteria bacterium]|nr:glycogen synthase [Acidobacteriota bacterium]
MKILILTNEYPPNVYGGAGVHVEYLVRELARADASSSIQVLCFGDQEMDGSNLRVRGVDRIMQSPDTELRYPELQNTLVRQLSMIGCADAADIIHCHTWYTHLAGCLLKQLLGGRLVLTTHSLEPHRPWKAEQLGPAYNASSWMEETAYRNCDGVIAVSKSMKEDVRRLYKVQEERIGIIHNGIDATEYRPRTEPEVLPRYGINPQKPYILFVGRMTRQKGILHLINSVPYCSADVQMVLCAGAADTKEMEAEIFSRVEEVRRESRKEIVWVPQIVPKPDIFALYSLAELFVCPSVYEPFGIINLESMACGTPVVASKVGGIPEIVVDGETGLLVPFDPENTDRFSRDLASAIDSLLASPERLAAMGRKSRERVKRYFSWQSIARQTWEFYRRLAS